MSYDAQEIADVFGRAAAGYDSVIPFFSVFGERLVEFADLRPGERVIDVGCGRGAVLFPAADRVGPDGEVLGVDLSEDMVGALAADIDRRGATNASVRRMDAEALGVEGAFDAAIAGFVLHLVPDPERVAAGLLGALRPGGRCVASAPIGAGPAFEFLQGIFQAFGPRATRRPPVPFRPGFDVAAVLASAGGDLVATMEEEIRFVFPDERAWWDWSWSQGTRTLFEVLTSADLEELRAEVFAGLGGLRTPEGIPMDHRATFVLARKP